MTAILVNPDDVDLPLLKEMAAREGVSVTCSRYVPSGQAFVLQDVKNILETG